MLKMCEPLKGIRRLRAVSKIELLGQEISLTIESSPRKSVVFVTTLSGN